MFAARAGTWQTLYTLTRNTVFRMTRRDMDEALLVATEAGHARCMRVLLESFASVDTKDFMGRTPLWYACRSGNIKCVEQCLKHEARVDIADSCGVTPLMAAARTNAMICAEMLLDAGADPDVKDHRDRTAADYAEMRDNFNMMKLLKNAPRRTSKLEAFDIM
jgi:ankyrin repeat protein